MQAPDTILKKIYNNTASTIMSLSFDKKINESEMLFLLNLLEMLWEEGDNTFITTLIQWQNSPKSAEMEEIIKQTLISLDFSDEQALQDIIAMLEDLLLQPKVED